jgi:Cytochrome c peroxidase
MKPRCVVGCLLFASLLLAVCACRERVKPPTPYTIEVPRGFPTRLNIPDDNPMTVEGVALGELLFHDPHLCGYRGDDPDSLMTCATCHVREHNYDIGLDNVRFSDGVARGRSTGRATRHNVMPLTNLVFNSEGYFWNGNVHGQNPNTEARTIEDIVRMAILADDEMCSTPERTLAALRADSRYPQYFKAAFGSEEITMDRVEKAIAQYVRSLVSAHSKFDRYLDGSEQLTPQELRGYVLFATEEGADCFHCHGGDGTPLFTTNLFYNNGLDDVFTDDHDRSFVTGDPMDRGAYRAPSLRNVAVSAPYMHDGRYRTLDEVLAFYNEGLHPSPYISPLMHKVNDGGAHLTPSELDAIKAFLLTLTDEEFLQK